MPARRRGRGSPREPLPEAAAEELRLAEMGAGAASGDERYRALSAASGALHSRNGAAPPETDPPARVPREPEPNPPTEASRAAEDSFSNQLAATHEVEEAQFAALAAIEPPTSGPGLSPPADSPSCLRWQKHLLGVAGVTVRSARVCALWSLALGQAWIACTTQTALGTEQAMVGWFRAFDGCPPGRRF
jgi:hypothetical protein